MLKSWSPADSITLEQLTLKLFIMLVALISAARKSSIDKFGLRFRFFKSNGVLFKVPGLIKCADQNKPIISFLASFPPVRRLCFTTYQRIYERKTKVFHPTSVESKNLLFLSYIKPHKPVSSSTLVRWAKSVLSLVGIDTTIFKPHSTRSAASFNAGVALPDILERANWTNESTFTR